MGIRRFFTSLYRHGVGRGNEVVMDSDWSVVISWEREARINRGYFFSFFFFFFHGALRPQKPYGLVGTGLLGTGEE